MASTTESALRRRAENRSLSKSRDRSIHWNNCGEYMLADHRRGVVLGCRYDAPLEEVADFLSDKAPERLPRWRRGTE